VLDAGNFGDLNPSYGLLKSDFMFKAMQRSGYDAVTPGEREFKWDLAHWEEMAAGSPEILANNLVDQDGGSVGQPPMIRDIGGVKVGVFGLVHSDIIQRGGPEAQRTYAALDIFESSDAIMDDLRAADCEIVVLMAQMELSYADSLVRRHPDIDVAVLGHRSGLRTTHATVENTILMRTGSRGQYLGWLDLEVDPAGEIVEFGGQAIMLDDHIEHDPAVQTMVNEVKAEIDRLKNEDKLLKQSEFQNQQQVDRYLGAQTCARCHQPEFEQWQVSGHARAWETLVEVGMETNEECVSCHVTGYGQTTGFESARIKPDLTDVQCEACHQMGTLHESGEAQAQFDLSSCGSCHDAVNSPEFDATAYLERIKHW